MHLSMVSPRVGWGGGATHGKLTQSAFPWAGILTQSWEFDMPATLEDLENLEMTYIVFASWYWKDFSFSRGWYSWEFLVPYSDQKVSFSRPGL